MRGLRSASPPVGRRVGALVVGAAALLAACGGGDDAPSADAGDERGRTVFVAKCAACHGRDLRGSEAGPSLLSIVYEPGHHPDDSFRTAIANGVRAHHWDFGNMPPVAGLTAADVDAVIAYVRSVQEREGFEPYPPR